MVVKFVGANKRVNDFLMMARLLSFLESDASKKSKVLEIKLARDEGLISEDVAIELACEFC